MGNASSSRVPKENSHWLHHAVTLLRKNSQKTKVVFHTGCAQRHVSHTASLVLGCWLLSASNHDQRMLVYREWVLSFFCMPLLFFTIKNIESSKQEQDFRIFFSHSFFLAFTFVKGMKDSSSGNSFSAAQYCPVGAPQENASQRTKDSRKGLY